VNSEAEFSDSGGLHRLENEVRREFQQVKVRLRLLAESEGLLPGDD
jgi:hypothetical protein